MVLGGIAGVMSAGGNTASYANVMINSVPMTGTIHMEDMANVFVVPVDCERAECISIRFDGRLQTEFVLTGGRKAEDVLVSGQSPDVQAVGNDRLLISKGNINFSWLDGITIGTSMKTVEAVAGKGECLNSSGGGVYVYEDAMATVIIRYSEALSAKGIELYFN